MIQFNLVLLFLTLLTFSIVVLSQNTFTALTYNVAGIPQELNDNGEDNKTQNALEIGKRFSKEDYDFINVQEDFNYHDLIYQTDTHKYRTNTSGPVLFGSGLNTLSNFPISNVKRITWEECFPNEADCFTPKGFTFLTLTLPFNQKQIDVYNLHADSGDMTQDGLARESNFNQLTQFIQENSKDRAIIVMGDTNARYTHPIDKLEEFIQSNKLIDPWVVLHHSNTPPTPGSPDLVCHLPIPFDDTCEGPDKIFYRSSKDVELNVISWEYEAKEFIYGSKGKPLSDHSPTKATFTVN